MTFGAVAAGVGAAASVASAVGGLVGSNTDAAGNAIGAGSLQAQNYLTNAAAASNGLLNPYINSGANSQAALNYLLGLPDTGPKLYTQADVPTYNYPNGSDPIWNAIIGQYQKEHQAKYGKPLQDSITNHPDVFQTLSSQYLGLKNQQAQQDYATQKAQTDQQLQAQGLNRGDLLKNFSAQDYQNDPGYTPFVNTLEQLQATPGYQFQLQQGLQSLNNSAAAKGSLLSGSQLKDVNNYAQGVASTGYQQAFDRAQTAYQNAYNRFVNNQNNLYGRLSGQANAGQTAATSNANNQVAVGSALAGNATNTAASQANLGLYQGQLTQNAITGVGNGVNQFLAGLTQNGSRGTTSNTSGYNSLPNNTGYSNFNNVAGALITPTFLSNSY